MASRQKSGRVRSLAICMALAVNLMAPSVLLAATEKEEILDLLAARRYPELDRRLNDVQRGYVKGEVSELDLLETFRAFYTTDPKLHDPFHEWAKLYPRSYAARLARGIYNKRIGGEYRGDGFAAETPRYRMELMAAFYEKAMTDFEASLELEEKPILTYLYMMDIQKYSGRWSITLWFWRLWINPNRYTLNQALAVAPDSFILRRKFMHTLEARWGGVPGEMEAFFAESRKARLKREELDALLALVHADRGWQRYVRRDFVSAFNEYERASKLIDVTSDRLFEYNMRSVFLHGIASGYYGVQKHQEALAWFDKAIAAGADEAGLYASRGWSLRQLNRKKEALDDYMKAAQKGDAWAQNQVGIHYWHGILVDQNRDEARKWFKRSAEQGFAEGKKHLEWANKL